MAGADESEELLLNLTVDGVREGAYMLCKHADDLLGHHARQAFREKAASMRAENSVYYVLKELMKTFGAQQHAPKRRSGDAEPPPLVLEAHEFRKLVASDPAFESAVPSDQVDALFYRIVDQDAHQKLIRLTDFLEFCLLDQDQLCVLAARVFAARCDNLKPAHCDASPDDCCCSSTGGTSRKCGSRTTRLRTRSGGCRPPVASKCRPSSSTPR